MASEYHKWLARNEKPEKPKEITKQEKWKTWWYYYWKFVAVGIVAVAAVVFLVMDIADSKANQPDCQIAYIGTQRLPGDTVAALREQLIPLIGDVDGNGRVIIKIQQYTVSAGNENFASDDPNQQMAMMAQLSVNENFLFLLENPVGFQNRYGLLTRPDGSSPADRSEPVWYAWADCPVLTALDLGEYSVSTGSATPLTGRNQELFSRLYIGRSTVEGWSQEQADAYCKIWESILAGAD